MNKTDLGPLLITAGLIGAGLLLLTYPEPKQKSTIISEFNCGSSQSCGYGAKYIPIPKSCIFPFKGKLIPYTVSQPKVTKLCNTISAKYNYYMPDRGPLAGCSIGGKSDPNMQNKCIIVTDRTKDTWDHEIAHCNGWPYSHPLNYRCKR